MLRFGKAATPLTAVAVVAPDNVPPPAFIPSATVTLPVKAVTVLPWASWALTCTAGVIAVPAVVFVGWMEKTSWLAAPGVTLNAALVAPVSPLAVATRVYAVPTLFTLRFANVATPFTAVVLVVPDNVAPPGFTPSATVTFPVKVVAVLPEASRAVTWPRGGLVVQPEHSPAPP